MRRMGGKLGLLVAVLAMLGTARPAQADFDVILRPGNFDDVRNLVLLNHSHGFFKCPVVRTLLDLLNAAQASSGSTRIARLQAALDCCSQLTREINPATGQPWCHEFLLEGVFACHHDLANFNHRVVDQVSGRCLCIGIRRLRDHFIGPALTDCFRVVVSGNSTAVACGPVVCP